ncbi:hypothetical protein REPUB_Repub07fG0082300 [Reevesia pubescens]
MLTSSDAAFESLLQIKSTGPSLWLVPKQELTLAVRAASKHLFSSLKPLSPKSPFDQLLIEGFDAEQIWLQIDLQSQPLLSTLRREVKKFEKHPEDISKLKEAVKGGKKEKFLEENETDKVVDDDEEDDDDMYMDMDEDGDEDDEEEEEEEEKEKGREEEVASEGEENGGIEDKFFKMKELQAYLEEDAARELGFKRKKTKTETKKDEEDTEGEEGDDDDEAEKEEDELGLCDGDDEDNLEIARYEDFFSGKKKKGFKEKAESRDRLEEDSGSDDEHDVDMRKDGLSTHEKELDKLRSKIDQMEKANLDPNVWTMRGENSALEVDLDFEHNVRPAPVITEEVTASLEDLIKNRISEGWFDDVQKASTLSSKASREIKELASMLFKKLCLKLDALSHFHFTPKPVVEDMSIQTNVPALAMEEARKNSDLLSSGMGDLNPFNLCFEVWDMKTYFKEEDKAGLGSSSMLLLSLYRSARETNTKS